MHPDRVLAAAVSPGGWPIAPVAIDQGDELRYPVGIADVKSLTGCEVDLEALRRIRLLFFLGDHDTNDAVPNLDSFSEADTEFIKRRFGETPIERWGLAQRLYRAAKMDAQFKTCPGVGHWVTPEMREDIVDGAQQTLRPMLIQPICGRRTSRSGRKARKQALSRMRCYGYDDGHVCGCPRKVRFMKSAARGHLAGSVGGR